MFLVLFFIEKRLIFNEPGGYNHEHQFIELQNYQFNVSPSESRKFIVLRSKCHTSWVIYRFFKTTSLKASV